MKVDSRHAMLLARFLSQEFWVIEPGRIEAVLKGFSTFSLFDEFFDEPRPLPVNIQNGIATMIIEGVLMRGPGSFWGGIVSTSDIEKAFKALVADPDVSKIVMSLDTPGGEVAGIKELAHLIYSSREQKKSVAFTPWSMCSAGYWIGSACTEVYAAENSRVGSIGARYTHYDYSAVNEQAGLKVTEIASGKWKALGSEEHPLSEEELAKLQEYINEVADGFFADVNLFRGLPVKDIQAMEADIFSGKKATAIGLIDGVSSLSEIIKSKSNKETEEMDIEKVKKAQAMFPNIMPETVAAIFNLAAAAPAEEMQKKAECEDDGKYYYDSNCHDKPKPPAATDPAVADPAEDMDEEAKCKADDKYWYDGKCNDEPKSPDATDPAAAEPETKEDCEKKDGYKWTDGKCVKEDAPPADDSEASAMASKALREVAMLKGAMEGMIKAAASSIMDGEMRAATGISVKTKQSLRRDICFKPYVSASGTLDADKYKAAIQAEIAAWKEDLYAEKGMEGFNSESDDFGSKDKAFDGKSYLDKQRALAGVKK